VQRRRWRRQPGVSHFHRLLCNIIFRHTGNHHHHHHHHQRTPPLYTHSAALLITLAAANSPSVGRCLSFFFFSLASLEKNLEARPFLSFFPSDGRVLLHL
jgi:hypothetical protein